jgi:microcin C transport system ATP-binding protein
VLDEPTSALDVTIQKQVLKLLQRLQRERGLSYLLITHDVDVIWAMAHEVLVMKDGEVVESGTVQEVLQTRADPYTQTLVAAAAEGSERHPDPARTGHDQAARPRRGPG